MRILKMLLRLLSLPMLVASLLIHVCSLVGAPLTRNEAFLSPEDRVTFENRIAMSFPPLTVVFKQIAYQ